MTIPLFFFAGAARLVGRLVRGSSSARGRGRRSVSFSLLALLFFLEERGKGGALDLCFVADILPHAPPLRNPSLK